MSSPVPARSMQSRSASFLEMPRVVMLQGTGSGVGKSLLTAGLCRWLANRDFRVRPFKAQNMSNNAGVTADGDEMGRAQFVQAEAAGVEPHTDMNPVLLKPEADRRSQVVLDGRVHGHITPPAGVISSGRCGAMYATLTIATMSSSSKAPAVRPRST